MLFGSVKVFKMVGQMPFGLQSNKTLILINFVLIHIIFLEKQSQTALVCKGTASKTSKSNKRDQTVSSHLHVCIRVATIDISHLLSTSELIGSTLHRLSKSKIKQEIYKLQSQKFPINIRS